MRLVIAAIWLGLASLGPASGEDIFVVAPQTVPDQKAVFATVESRRVVPARARIGGTVAELAVKEGDRVELGQVVASVGDEKIALQMKSLDAQIAGLQAQLAQAQTDLTRTEDLVGKGTLPRTRLDEARTAFTVASNAMQARIAERSVIAQQLAEGSVLAPAAGRVLKVPLTTGTVILAGESVADIAEQDFVLRLRVPERYARFLKAGDPIRLDAGELGQSGARSGTIRLVYPRIEDGRVVADAQVEGLGDYFVSERVRVWVSAGDRPAFVVPASYITTRFGVDYVKLRGAGPDIDVPVQRGREQPQPGMPDGIEILSGLSAGDRLVRP
jgi:RND family efflux transporter MFP subunit